MFSSCAQFHTPHVIRMNFQDWNTEYEIDLKFCKCSVTISNFNACTLMIRESFHDYASYIWYTRNCCRVEQRRRRMSNDPAHTNTHASTHARTSTCTTHVVVVVVVVDHLVVCYTQPCVPDVCAPHKSVLYQLHIPTPSNNNGRWHVNVHTYEKRRPSQTAANETRAWGKKQSRRVMSGVHACAFVQCTRQSAIQPAKANEKANTHVCTRTYTYTHTYCVRHIT